MLKVLELQNNFILSHQREVLAIKHIVQKCATLGKCSMCDDQYLSCTIGGRVTAELY